MKRAAFGAKKLISRHSSLCILILAAVLVTGGGVYALTRADSYVKTADAALNRSVNELFDQAMGRIQAKKQAEAKKQADEAAKAEADKEAATQAVKQPDQKQHAAATGCGFTGPHSDPSAVDVLVNKKHCLTPLSYYPPDLQTVYGATLSAKAAGPFKQMADAASAAGLGFQTSSSFRSYDNQVSTYNYWVQVGGSVAEADKGSARPGYSEHQTGYAADLTVGGCGLDCFTGTAQYQWLQAHAADYGFIERYPQGYEAITGYRAESWHWRYVGTAIAQAMKTSGIKTLEQQYGLEGGDYR